MTPTSTQRLIATVQTANARWRDYHNPLRSLSMPRAVAMMEQAQAGMMADLQWTYAAETGIEATDPDLYVIVERTVAALRDFEWTVGQISDETQGFDKALADDQEAALRADYESCRNLYEALAHLALARFRGFAHVNPHLTPGGTLQRLEILDQWNLARDGYAGAWYWNPEAKQVAARSLGAAARLNPEDYIALVTRRPVNRIGLIKYVRATTAEKDWDAYVETYGLPGFFIVMPSNIPPGQEGSYRDAAEDAAKGTSGALPPGSDVKPIGESTRSTQPFQPRLAWLQQQLVMAGTGGLLTVLAQSGSGTLAGNAHLEAFRQISRGLARQIAEAFQAQRDAATLGRLFPGRPVLAYFDIAARDVPDTSAAVKDAVALAAAFDLDPAEVSQRTGFTIRGQR